ncbi:MAG: transaminase [Acidimicrobiales bacterium]|jgi:glutamate-1-semialdehyde 2,1-aminomutase|nr:transaminase [Acidimicrobiales bacterium]
MTDAFDRRRLQELVDREAAAYAADRPRARAAHDEATSLLGGVPMTWMNKWAGGFPIQLERAHGNRVTDTDGHTYVDFALGDTGAMAGHAPAPVARAVERVLSERGGITAMLPTEDAAWVGAELARRFRVQRWSFTLTATDANRWALRLARMVTGRPRILVFSYCYHGSVDETIVVVGPDGRPMARPGNVGPAVDPTTTTRVVEFNDLDAVARELAHGDVAAILTEPALTNIGIVLPEPGFLDGLRSLADAHGALLVIDETHTFSAGPGGCTGAWDLRPDVVTIGKSIAGGIPIGAYGLTESLAERVLAMPGADLVDVGGIGGTLAGNALSLAAARATLGEVLTPEAFSAMCALGDRYTAGIDAAIRSARLPWSVVQLGARAEVRFASPAPRNGGGSAAAADDLLDDYVHLYLLNRGVLLTPFHNMALMCPATTAVDVDLHVELFAAAAQELVG